MKLHQSVRLAAAAFASLLALASFSATAARADVNVMVNGNPVSFTQPPIERGGRVFVPLRGVFERLGASVVYDNGTINATGQGHNIQLHIGSTAAMVDGATRQLDVAPFIVGSSTLVPLRFISESLGANVAYDNSNQTVTINSGGTSYVQPQPNTSNTQMTLGNLRPRSGSVNAASKPAISGTFGTPVDPNSVRILLDGRDISGTAYVSSTDFQFTPGYNLTAQRHTVEVSGRAQTGATFDRSWSFSSGSGAVSNSTTNFLQNLTPANGSTVGDSFTVSGITLPNANVRIAASGSNMVGGVFRAVTGTYTTNVRSDSNGNFSQSINLTNVGNFVKLNGGQVAVQITSVDPNTNAGASAILNLLK
jgi:hypothetical protein